MSGLKKRYSDEEILKQMREHYLKRGSITTKSFDEDKEVCSLKTVRSRFGSWNNAIKELGVKEKLLRTLKEKAETKELLKYRKEEKWKELRIEFGLEEYSEEEIQREYIKFKRENKQFAALVMAEEIKEKYVKTKKISSRDFNARVIKRNFGRWENALQETGLEELILKEKQEYIFEKMKKFIEKTGRKPYDHEYRAKYGLPSIVRINHYFGNKSVLLKEFGFERGIVGNEITKSQILEMIQDFYKKEGRKPQAKDFKKKNNMPSMEQIYFHYSGINEAMEKSGFKVTARKKVYTREEALKGLYDFYIREGREPLKEDIKNENGLPSLKKLRSIFGTLGNAKEEANIPSSRKRRQFYIKEEVEQSLINKYLEKGERLTNREIDEDKELPTTGTILNVLRIQLFSDLWPYLEKKYKLKK